MKIDDNRRLMASEFGVRQLDAALERRGLTRLSMKRPVKPGHGKAVSSHRSPNQNEDKNGPNQASHATACTPRMKANVVWRRNDDPKI